MIPWFRKDCGDPTFAGPVLDRIVNMFPLATTQGPPPVGRAVFTRHESEGRLQCTLVAYFSPDAAGLAKEAGAVPCEPPAPGGLDLLAGSPAAWEALFPGRRR